MSETPIVLTLGHSNHPWPEFLELLQRNHVGCIVDVRSMPASRRCPQFNRNAVERALRDAGIGYRFLGDRLGGRPKDPAGYTEGVVDYDKVAKTSAFCEGLDQLAGLARAKRCCVMCAERDPLDCHRAILVARHLAPKGYSLSHIHGDGRIETQGEFERRLIDADEAPLLADVEDGRALLQLAYNRRGRRMAFKR